MSHRDRRARAGFTMVELLVVMMIIGVMVATAIPAIAQYIRLYDIRAAAQQVSAQIQSARTRAVQKNVNLGVVWGMVDNRQSGSVIEDDQNPLDGTRWTSIGAEDWTFLLANPSQGAGIAPLPRGIVFDAPGSCAGGGAVTTTWGLRFNRLGGMCAPANAPDPCQHPPNLPGSYPNLVGMDGGQASICLLQPRTGLQVLLSVTPGGRVRIQEGWR